MKPEMEISKEELQVKLDNLRDIETAVQFAISDISSYLKNEDGKITKDESISSLNIAINQCKSIYAVDLLLKIRDVMKFKFSEIQNLNENTQAMAIFKKSVETIKPAIMDVINQYIDYEKKIASILLKR